MSDEERDRSREREEFLEKISGYGAAKNEPEEKGCGDGEPRAVVVESAGVVALNGPAIRLIVKKLHDDMAKDPNLKKIFYEDPRRVLGAVGLNQEIQNELLRNEVDFQDTPFFKGSAFAWPCLCTSCCCTGCCFTCWSTGR
jgi:hypothetical protein